MRGAKRKLSVWTIVGGVFAVLIGLVILIILIRNAKVEKQDDLHDRYYECTDKARKSHSIAWQDACRQENLGESCSLSLEQSQALEDFLNDELDRCAEAYASQLRGSEEYYKNCREYENYVYNKKWNNECEFWNLQQSCSLPSELAKIHNESLKRGLDRCMKFY